MKACDKVFCIKNNFIIRTGKINNIKNNIYTLIWIRDNVYSVSGEINNTEFYGETFFKYFISLKKQRKLKINEIENRR